jgi:hypothetical protein
MFHPFLDMFILTQERITWEKSYFRGHKNRIFLNKGKKQNKVMIKILNSDKKMSKNDLLFNLFKHFQETRAFLFWKKLWKTPQNEILLDISL